MRILLYSFLASLLISGEAEKPVVYDNFLPWQQKHIIPVIHNLEYFQVSALIDALDGIRCCTVSLRHSSALSSLKDLTEQFGPYCDVGVSTVVSTNQVHQLLHITPKTNTHQIIALMTLHVASRYLKPKRTGRFS